MSQSRNPSVECNEQSVAVQFDPKQSRFTGFATGELAIGCLAIVSLALMVVLTWGKDSPFAKWFVAGCLIFVFIFLMVNFFLKKPKVSVTHKVVSFDGIGEKTVASMFGAWLSRTAPPHLPEPDAKFDPTSGKVLPFQPGEKEKVVAEQNQIEETVKKEIATLSASAIPARHCRGTSSASEKLKQLCQPDKTFLTLSRKPPKRMAGSL